MKNREAFLDALYRQQEYENERAFVKLINYEIPNDLEIDS